MSLLQPTSGPTPSPESPVVQALTEFVGKDIYIEQRNGQRTYGYAQQLQRFGDALYLQIISSMEYEPVSRDRITAQEFHVNDVFYARVDTATVIARASALHKSRFGPDLNTLEAPPPEIGNFLDTLKTMRGVQIAATFAHNSEVLGTLTDIVHHGTAAWLRISSIEGFAGFVDGQMKTSETRLLNLANVDRIYSCRD